MVCLLSLICRKMSKRRKAFPRGRLPGAGERGHVLCQGNDTFIIHRCPSFSGEALGMLQRERVWTRDPGSHSHAAILCLWWLQLSSVRGHLSLLCHVSSPLSQKTNGIFGAGGSSHWESVFISVQEVSLCPTPPPSPIRAYQTVLGTVGIPEFNINLSPEIL